METAGPRPIAPGTKLDAKYRIEQLLAVGGMGAVYLGTHTALRKRVAIKVLNPQTSTTAMVERFHREAITASQIGHEGIAQVTDVGTSFEGEPFLVMEYLEGESLAARLTTTGRLPIEIACELGCAILAPLAAAHAAGIVHRDLKPDNVFLVRQSRGEMVKLLDFGISRAPGLEGEFRLTKTGLVLGTPYYMSPEQARGESEVGLAADLYAFGVILYEMLLGKVPIEGDNYNQLMFRVLTGEYVLPRTERPEIPEELEQIILQAMALDPAKRPTSASELERQLLAFCRPTFRDHQIERISSSSGLSLHALSAGVTAPMMSAAAQDSMSMPRKPSVLTPTETTAPTQHGPSAELTAQIAPTTPTVVTGLVRRPRRALWIASGAAVVCGVLVGALVIAKRGGGERPAPPAVAPAEQAPAPPKQAAAGTDKPAPATERKPAGSSEKAVAAEIILVFATEPPTAVVELDGARVDARQITVPKDGATHKLRVTASGYTPYEDQVRFDMSQKLIIPLKRVGSRPTRPRNGSGTRDPKPERIEIKSPYDQ